MLMSLKMKLLIDLEAFGIFILVHYIHTIKNTYLWYTIHFLKTMSGSIVTIKLVNILFKHV